jgi:hypothetical protein
MLGLPMSVDLVIGGRGSSQSLFRTTIFKSVNELFQERRLPTKDLPFSWSREGARLPYTSGYYRPFLSL